MRTDPIFLTSALNKLSEEAIYRSLFIDLQFWEPFVLIVCRRHHLEPCKPIRTGISGTFPTFIAGDKWVVKFFGQLFSGAQSFRSEREIHHLLSGVPEMKVPRLFEEGKLLDGRSGWHWPYLVFEYIPGVSIGEVYAEINMQSWVKVAREIAGFTHQLHEISPPPGSIFDRHWDTYIKFLNRQRASVVENQRRWGSLPPHLIDQIDSYLCPIQELVDLNSSPSLIHADLTRDHLIGDQSDGEWVTRAIIDFGDAMTGSPFYELAALHFDLFGLQPQVLNEFLRAYGCKGMELPELAHRLMSTALLHQFDLFTQVFSEMPETREVNMLQELTQLIYLQ